MVASLEWQSESKLLEIKGEIKVHIKIESKVEILVEIKVEQDLTLYHLFLWVVYRNETSETFKLLKRFNIS